LKNSAGARFPKSPYEIWPLLSSPCDLFSLSVMTVRILLANSQSNLPVVLDEVLSLARRLNEISPEKDKRVAELKSMLQKEPRLNELVSPRSLVEAGYDHTQAWAAINRDIWLETVSLLLRFFPGTGIHSYCKSFGDVSPLALETIFDQPIQELELLILRLRSLLIPALSANEEIVFAIADLLKKSAKT
jgi:hypothetical protein